MARVRNRKAAVAYGVAAALGICSLTAGVGVGEVAATQASAAVEPVESATTHRPEQTPMKLWYDEPAADSDDGWVDQSLPLGNGYMGVNLFGGVQKDRLQITENSLQDRDSGYGRLNSFAEVFLDVPHQRPTRYSRDLDVDDAVAHVAYENDGVEYTREYFTSYPDKVLAIRLGASEAGAVDFTLRPTIPYLADYRDHPGDNRGKHGTVTASGDTVTLSGSMEYYDVQFEGQLKVVLDGGTMQALNDANGDHGRIRVTGADSATILVAVGTNYRLSSQVFTADRLGKLKGVPHPHEKVTTFLADAASRSYDELLARHQADYTELYDRVAFDLGAEEPAIPTDEVIDAARKGAVDPYLEELAFQYGRYLLICSSRAGTLPPNLQGIWNVYQDAPWGAGYWHNVNVQMNYGPAFSTNLPELFESYVDFYQAYVERQRQLATQYVTTYNPSRLAADGDNGWAMGTGMWPYSPSYKAAHSGFGTGGWTAMMFWNYYDYTRDRSTLEDVVYPALRGQSNFLSRIVKDHDGLLLADPSSSPENASSLQTVGTTFDQQMIYENHRNTLQAASILGRSDPLLDTLRAQLPKLDPIQVGKSGQIKEYREEEYYGEIGDPRHRHISQLLGLYPGQLVNSTTPAWLDAAKVSLIGRGPDTGVGWSQAERVATWARALDGDRAHASYTDWLRSHAMHNLWDSVWPTASSKVFQVDGNFGVTAGVSEMLLQSHDEVVAPLAALPTAWDEGSYRRLLARGNFEVSARWSEHHADRIEVLSKSGTPLRLRYPGIAGAVIRTADGDQLDIATHGPDEVSLATTAGETYVITDIPEDETVAPPVDVEVSVEARDAIKLTWTGSDGASSYDVDRAVGSEPGYERVATGVTGTQYVDSSAQVVANPQATYRVTAVGESGRESLGATVVRLRPDTTPTRILRVGRDLVGYGDQDGHQDDVEMAGGRYTVGMNWQNGNLTDIRLSAHKTGVAVLRNQMFTSPVRVYRDGGRPTPHRVRGDRLVIPVSAGRTYRIVAQAVVEVKVPPAAVRPGSTVPVTFTLRAADHQTVPASAVRVDVADGWAVAQPDRLKLRPVRRGESTTGEFIVTAPRTAEDGRYTVDVVVSTDDWSISAPVAVEVHLPNIAVGRPATQSSEYSGGAPGRAVDGNTNGVWGQGSVAHTASGKQSWWQVDLGSSQDIGSIAVWNRTDCCADRLRDFQVLVSDEPFVSGSLDEVLAQPGVWSHHVTAQPGPVTQMDVGRGGRYVRVQLTGTNYLALAEVQVFPAIE
ncbi:hypothetical protein GCM10009809_12130 [Isoptericola hypogeus]|uniref:F5/8 type C domain-containing protein n=1 Tax=Isoptericola hypogeus TaxID=300179 RepID=A0ABN2J4E3_9MICO